MTADKCARCNKVAFVVDPVTGEEACSACGMVTKDRVESLSAAQHSGRRQHFNGEKDEKQHGPFRGLQHEVYQTIISESSRDYAGGPVTNEFKRLRNGVGSQRRKVETNKVKFGLAHIRLLTEKLQLPDATAERAAFIFKKIAKLKKGDPAFCGESKPLAGASVYLACKEHAIQRRPEDIARESGLDTTGKFIRVAVKIKMYSGLSVSDHISADMAPRLIMQCCEALKLSLEIKERAIELSKLQGLATGKSPRAVAAGATWFAFKECHSYAERQKITRQIEVADFLQVTTASINHIRADIERRLLYEKSK